LELTPCSQCQHHLPWRWRELPLSELLINKGDGWGAWEGPRHTLAQSCWGWWVSGWKLHGDARLKHRESVKRSCTPPKGIPRTAEHCQDHAWAGLARRWKAVYGTLSLGFMPGDTAQMRLVGRLKVSFLLDQGPC
jgi:hypothetical protein